MPLFWLHLVNMAFRQAITAGQLRASSRWMRKVKVQSVSLLIFMFLYQYLCLSHPILSIRDTLITNCWHITWLMAKDVWAIKQPQQSAKNFIRGKGQRVALIGKCTSYVCVCVGVRTLVCVCGAVCDIKHKPIRMTEKQTCSKSEYC